MKSSMKPRFLLLLSVCASSACAENPHYPPVIDNSTYQEGAAQPARAPSNDAMIELLERMEQLQSEVQGLRGQVEEQAHAIEELKRRQDNIYTDMDERLQKLEPAGASESETPQTTGAQSPAESQTPEEQAGAELQMGGESPQTAAPPAGEPGVMEEQPKPENIPAAPAESVPEAAEPLPGDEKQLYQHAYGALKNAQYDQAIVLLKKLAEDYPSGEYADNAYYWLGETYKIKRDTEASRAAFDHLITNYPASPKVPDAILKLGFLEYEQNNPDKARELFNLILSKYPGSSASHLAKNKLQQMDKR
jgi:tol-pal system protein YbgF